MQVSYARACRTTRTPRLVLPGAPTLAPRKLLLATRNSSKKLWRASALPKASLCCRASKSSRLSSWSGCQRLLGRDGDQAHGPSDFATSCRTSARRISRVRGSRRRLGAEHLGREVQHQVSPELAVITRDTDFMTQSPVARDSVEKFAQSISGTATYRRCLGLTSLFGKVVMRFLREEAARFPPPKPAPAGARYKLSSPKSKRLPSTTPAARSLSDGACTLPTPSIRR